MNNLLIAGNLAADPEVRFTSSGQKVTTIRMAVNNRRAKGDDSTMWWRVTIWGDSMDKLISYLKKGSSVIVTGEMSKPEIYTDKNGQPQLSLNMTAHNISFSPFGRGDKQQETQDSDASMNAGGGMGGADFAQPQQAFQGAPSSTFSDDEIPF